MFYFILIFFSKDAYIRRVFFKKILGNCFSFSFINIVYVFRCCAAAFCRHYILYNNMLLSAATSLFSHVHICECARKTSGSKPALRDFCLSIYTYYILVKIHKYIQQRAAEKRSLAIFFFFFAKDFF